MEMDSGAKKNPGLSGQLLVIAGLILVVVGGACFLWLKRLEKLRVPDRPAVMGTLPNWTLTKHDGTQSGMDDLKGRIWVADFIFTRCGGQCPMLTSKMQRLQNWLDENEMGNVKLVSFTVDPDNDTTQVLQEYAKTWKADLNRWSFFTGEQRAIYKLATEGFMLAAEDNQDGEAEGEMFIHSDRLILVDTDGQIRGMFPALEDSALPDLQTAIKSISREASTGAKS